MPTDGWGSVWRMAEAFALVAAVAVPLGLLAWRVGRRATPGGLPTPAVDDAAYAVGYLFLFLAHPVAVLVLGQASAAMPLPGPVNVPSDADTAAVFRGLFGSLLTGPLVLAGWVGFRRAAGAGWSGRSMSAAVAVGAVVWLAVTPGVYAVNAVAEAVSVAAGVGPTKHPLVEAFASLSPALGAVMLAAVAVTTPFAEEVIFRGLLLGWLVRRPAWVWLPAGLAIVFAALTTTGTPAQGPAVGFVAVLLVGLAAVRHRPATAAVWATATLFAAVHSNVWPSPVPLFVLGLSLGAVAVRTGGVLAGTVMHGLFNAVSAVYLLRG